MKIKTIDGKELYEKLSKTKRIILRDNYCCSCRVCVYERGKRLSPEFEKTINKIFEHLGLQGRLEREEYKKGVFFSKENN